MLLDKTMQFIVATGTNLHDSFVSHLSVEASLSVNAQHRDGHPQVLAVEP